MQNDEVERVAWDQRYRHLEEGEIVLSTDEVQNDDCTWRPAVGGVGMPAPNPHYTSHRVYRRLKDHPMTDEDALVEELDALARGADETAGCGCGGSNTYSQSGENQMTQKFPKSL